MQHLLSIDALTKDDILTLLSQANAFKKALTSRAPIKSSLTNQVAANLFFENSTRTLNSFALAETHLNMTVLSPSIEQSAIKKGESLLDTCLNLHAMGARIQVIRHPESTCFEGLTDQLPADCHLINAGNGTCEHPTQALIDIFTLHEQGIDFSALKIAIVGDVKHSRVAHSAIKALQTLGTRDIRICAPTPWLPNEHTAPDCTLTTQLDVGLNKTDVVMCLRVQHERQTESAISPEDYIEHYQINKQRIEQHCPNTLIMHPGPINRDVELSHTLANSAQSLILAQAGNGVPMRMAVLNSITPYKAAS